MRNRGVHTGHECARGGPRPDFSKVSVAQLMVFFADEVLQRASGVLDLFSGGFSGFKVAAGFDFT